MPAKPWTDEPRKTFLEGKLLKFESAQEQKQTKKFMQLVHEEYFNRFPEPDEVKKGAERKRVSNWFNNHSGGRLGGKRDVPLIKNTRSTFTAMLLGTVEQRRKQKLQATQAYSELYWESKLRATVLSEWKQKRVNEPDLPKTKFLPFMNMRIKQLYEAEGPDVHSEVEHYRQNKFKEGVADGTIFLLPGEEELDSAEQERRIQGRKTQAAIQNVQPALTEVAKVIEEYTGLKCHFMVAGPEPRRKGRILTITVTAGKSIKSKRKFPDFSPLYRPNVAGLWKSFIKSCFSQEERTRYADVPFPGYEEEEESLQSLSNNAADALNKRTAPNAQKVKPSPPALRCSPSSSDDEDDEEFDPNTFDHGDPSENGAAQSNSYEDFTNEPVGDCSDNDSNVDEEDFAELMSTSLPPERRVVEKKVSEGSYTKYRIQTGSWLTYYELKRLANMARNADMIAALGIPEAASNLTMRSDVRERQKRVRTAADDDEYSGSRPQASLPTRTQPLRASNNQATCPDADSVMMDVINTSTPKAAGIVPEPVSDTSLSTTSASLLSPTTILACSLVPPTISNAPVSVAADNDLNMDIDNNECATVATTVATESRHLSPVEVNATVDTVLEHATSITLGLDSIDVSGLPGWLVGPAKYLIQHFRGEAEDELLAGLFALEMAWYPLDRKMGSVNRPAAVPWWIKNARPLSKVPSNIDLATFPDEFRLWWKTTQPSWRIPDSSLSDWPLSREAPPDEDWSCARRGGPNGLFLVIMCLHWWRCAAVAEDDRVALAEYLSVAEDVAFVFGEILHCTSFPVSASAPSPSSSSNHRPSTATTTIKSPKITRSSGKRGKRANLAGSVQKNRALRSPEINVRRSTRSRA